MRAVFCGAVTRRKGIHVLLEAWQKLSLPHAQLTLVGKIHEDMKPYLAQFAGPSVNAVGFSSCVDEVFRQSDVHIFPSECEGSPKSVYEACAAGLAQITTFEAGDVVLNDSQWSDRSVQRRRSAGKRDSSPLQVAATNHALRAGGSPTGGS